MITYVLTTLIISILIIGFFHRFFIVNLTNFSQDTLLALILLLVLCLLVIVPAFTLRYKINRDKDSFRIGYKNKIFMLISEKDNTVQYTIPLNKIDSIFLDLGGRFCFISQNKTQTNNIKSLYNYYDSRFREGMVGGSFAWLLSGLRFLVVPLLAYSVFQYSLLFRKLFEIAVGTRILNSRNMERFLDNIPELKKTKFSQPEKTKVDSLLNINEFVRVYERI